MMKGLGYEKPSFDYYYKEPKNDLDNRLKKLSSDQDVLQMLKYVEKYKVIDLYVDHYVTKETVNVDESLLVNELDNDLFIGNEMLRDNDEDVIEDVSEDEWLQKSLRLVGIKKKHAVENDNVRGPSSRNESMNVEDDRDDDNMIDDVDVDMVEFRSNIDANVEWVGSKAIVTMEEEEFKEEGVNHNELDSGSDYEYEGESKKALKMYDPYICHGIIPAIAKSFPSVEHRFYLKHIYDNMKLSWRGQLYKEMLWRCVTSTTVQRFDKHMEKLKDFNKDAYEWLKKNPPQHWSRSHFSGRAHYDVLLNNICKVFNKQFVYGRDKPIITCLEFIREYLMNRIVNVQKVLIKSDGPLTPNATKVFNKIMKEAGQMKVDWNGGDLYQATTPWGDQCVFNIRTKECSYRKWELIGILCKHALAAIWDMAGNGEETSILESYCHQVHWISTWKDMPPKKRKKSAAELAKEIVKGNKLSKAGKSITCGKCKGIGHNQRKCLNDASTQTITQTQQSSHASPTTQATKASQTGHTTPFHPS
nr:hypothetical protein [Tanacetum cinerariifolium]